MKQLNRNEVFLIISEFIFLKKTTEELFDYLELIEPVENYSEDFLKNELLNFIIEKNKGVSNGYLSDLYKLLIGENIEVIGNVDDMYPCNCCGYKTLSEKYGIDGGYDICDYCGWEDDGTVNPYEYSSVNQCSIDDKRTYMTLNHNLFYKVKWLK